MTLVRWQPRAMFDVSREIDRMVNTLWGGFGRNGNGHTEAWRPSVDAKENEDGYVVSAEVPGLSREDVKVTLKDGVLTIEGEKAHAADEKADSGAHWTARHYGKLNRSFRVPDDVDADKVSAVCKDGVLTVTLPKVEAVKPKEIEVKVA